MSNRSAASLSNTAAGVVTKLAVPEEQLSSVRSANSLPKNPRTTKGEEEFADDLLLGASEISLFLFGDRKQRRRVYHLYSTSNAPWFFKLGAMICARRSVVLKWIDQEERRPGNNSQRGRP